MSCFRASAALVLVPAIGALLAACGGGGPAATPAPTPLPPALLQQRYSAAAAAYDTGEVPVATAESQFCDPGAAGADLTKCASALSGDRQATVTFDDAIRGLRFPPEAQAAAGGLLDDDARLETLLEQAATAPSLTAVTSLTPQIFDLLSATARDADSLRALIGLPSTTPIPKPSVMPAVVRRPGNSLPLHPPISTDAGVSSCAPRSRIRGYDRCGARRFLGLGGLCGESTSYFQIAALARPNAGQRATAMSGALRT